MRSEIRRDGVGSTRTIVVRLRTENILTLAVPRRRVRIIRTPLYLKSNKISGDIVEFSRENRFKMIPWQPVNSQSVSHSLNSILNQITSSVLNSGEARGGRMVRYATKFGVETPYSIPNKGPTPKIDIEEGLPPGGLDIAWVEDGRKHLYHWSRGLKWYDRLHAHATLNSARKNVKCKRPFAPKDSLDLALSASYCPTEGVFFEKTDPCLQVTNITVTVTNT